MYVYAYNLLTMIKKRKMNCSRCKDKLTHTGLGGYDNALRITLDGGYAEFVDGIVFANDDFAKPPLGHILCHKCGHELMNWLKVPEQHIEGWHQSVESEPLCSGWVFPEN
jgi:hypothetical protein